MDEIESKPVAEPGLDDGRDQFESLRSLIISVMLLVIVFSGTLNIYLWRQVRYANADLSVIRPQVTQMMADYQKVNEPMIRDFVTKIAEFGRTHPDFAPILAKYNIKPVATGAPPVIASPAATKPKK